MAGLQQTVEYLSKSIGPRPAGTEEEQKAAVFIADQLQQVSGLPTATEEFNCNADSDIPAAVCSAVAVVVAIVGMLVGFMAVPCLVLALISAAVFVAEIFDKPVISRVLSRGISQNVVATYKPAVPASGRPGRQRKVVLVAHYDTGKVNPLLRKPILSAMPILQWVGVGGIVATALLMALRVAGVGGTVFRVLCIVAAVCAALPLLGTILNRISPYTEGANCNAAGVAVMLEVADRVAHGSATVSEDSSYTVHGPEAASASGFVPEGAELVYDALSTEGDSEQSARARLLSAKAAVAAMSGKPVSDTVHIDLADNLVKVQEPLLGSPTDEDMQEARTKTREALAAVPQNEENVEEHQGEEAPEAQQFDGLDAQAVVEEPKQDDVPEWFKAAQKKAKKPVTEGAPIYRSRYAQAMEAAQRAREEEERAAAEEAARAEAQRLEEEARRQAAEAAARAAELQAQMASVPVLAQEEAASVAPAIDEVPLEGSTMRFVPVAASREGGDVLEAPAAKPLVPAIAPPAAPVADGEVSVSNTPAPRTRRENFLSSLPSLSMPMAAVPAEEDSAEVASSPRRRSADIPAIDERPFEGAIQNQNFQPAPLAEPRPSGQERANRLRMTVPSLSGSITARPSASPQATAPAPRVVVPALGDDTAVSAVEESKTVATAGAFGSATGVFDPVGDELLEDVDAQEIYVEDVDDSDYQSQITETGAFAGPGYVSMPKSRLGRLFGKRRSKNKKGDEGTPQEWLSVDEGFDARSVGAARGGWESFRSEEEDAYSALNEEDDFGFGDDDSARHGHCDGRGRHWEGGAFSRESLGRVSTLSTEESMEPPVDDGMDINAIAGFDDSAAQSGEQGAAHDSVMRFHNPAVNVEVWFVALGAELANNGGMRAFLEEHAQDLRGAIIVDLEGLGAGELTLMEKEGKYLAKKPSSRMDRIVRKAASAVGISVGKGTQCWKDSASAFAMKHGHQAMHLVGQLDGKPAFFAERDDVAENVDEEALYVNSDFVMEVLRKI